MISLAFSSPNSFGRVIKDLAFVSRVLLPVTEPSQRKMILEGIALGLNRVSKVVQCGPRAEPSLSSRVAYQG